MIFFIKKKQNKKHKLECCCLLSLKKFLLPLYHNGIILNLLGVLDVYNFPIFFFFNDLGLISWHILK